MWLSRQPTMLAPPAYLQTPTPLPRPPAPGRRPSPWQPSPSSSGSRWGPHCIALQRRVARDPTPTPAADPNLLLFCLTAAHAEPACKQLPLGHLADQRKPGVCGLHAQGEGMPSAFSPPRRWLSRGRRGVPMRAAAWGCLCAAAAQRLPPLPSVLFPCARLRARARSKSSIACL